MYVYTRIYVQYIYYIEIFIAEDLLGTFIKRYGNELSQAMIPVEMIFMEPLLVNLLNQLFSKVPFSAVFP